MRYFYDCEFLEDGRTIELISIGIVGDDGRTYYAVNADMPLDRIKGHDWLVRNVLPGLPIREWASLDRYVSHPANTYPRPSIELVDLDWSDTVVKPHWVIANEVRDFLSPTHDPLDTELWAYYGAYDHVALCQLWGSMVQRPAGLPMITHELVDRWERAGRPEKPEKGVQHHALHDARWNRALYASTTTREAHQGGHDA